ncbi:MAG: hypothetical protein BWY21_00510 [Parcubacteria group bacterium ADurb.Bin216]|nr:MAG: hypothetical protein BWY21_00510 [Parcubacteria group bacterium ADurb.Bin216]
MSIKRKLIDYNKFILDNGEIRNCPNNINKMNYIEFFIFNLPILDRKWFIEYFYTPARDSIRNATLFWSGVFLYLTFPISYPMMVFILYVKKTRTHPN